MSLNYCTHVSVQAESRGGQDHFIYFTQIHRKIHEEKNDDFLHELSKAITFKKPPMLP